MLPFRNVCSLDGDELHQFDQPDFLRQFDLSATFIAVSALQVHLPTPFANCKSDEPKKPA